MPNRSVTFQSGPETDRALLELGRLLQDYKYRFVTVAPATHAKVNARRAGAPGSTLRDIFGWSRAFEQWALPAGMFELLQTAGAVARSGVLWRSLVRFSTLEGCLFVHSSFPTNETDSVFFGPDSYRFALAIRRHLTFRSQPVRRAVDIGAGAGPGAIVVARRCPAAWVGMLDTNVDALRMATINAALSGTSNVAAIQSSLLDAVDGSFDLIVSNPPYLMDPEQRLYRHGGGSLGEGLSLDILARGIDRLAPGGTLLLYTGTTVVDGVDLFRERAEAQLRETNLAWTYEELDPDVFSEELDNPTYGNADRIAVVLLEVTRISQ